MKKIFFLLLIELLLCSKISPQNIQALVERGLNKAYNMEIDAAEKIFNQIIDNNPNQPHGYFYIAKIHFWVYLGTHDIGEYRVFLKFAELAEEKIDKILGSEKNNVRIICMAGNLASYKAMAYATNESSVDAFWASKKAVSYFENALDINPKYYDAYLGLGIFDYAMSFVPDFLKWAVNLTGLTSDKERGLRYIKTAYQKGTNEKTEAAFHLTKIYSDYIAEYDSSYYYINKLTSKYPNNTLFKYLHSTVLIKDKEYETAMQLLNNVIRLDNKKFPQITALANYRKGEIYFKRNQFVRAIDYYKNFLELSKELDLNGMAAFNTAISYKMINNEEDYFNYLKLADTGNLDIFEDSYAKRKSEYFLNNTITDIDLKLIKYRNLIDNNRIKSAYDSLKILIDEINNNDQKVVALVYYSESALALKKYSDAVSKAEEILTIKTDSEKWVYPFSYLIQAKANYLVGGKSEALRLLDEAEDANDHDFKDYIQSLIENLKRKLTR